MTDLAFGGEDELQAFCARLLSGSADASDEEALAADAALAADVTGRLERCGVRLHRHAGVAPACVVHSGEEWAELPLACLSLCVLALGRGDRERSKRARLTVRELWERVGRSRGYSEAYVRRAGLGPLEARGLVRVVKPEQQASLAYIVADAALSAIDREAVARRLRSFQDAA